MVATLELPEDRRGKILVLAEDLLQNLGYELVDMEFSQSDEGSILRLFIDKEGGVTLDDMQTVISSEIDFGLLKKMRRYIVMR